MDKKDIASFGYDELIEEMKKHRREGISGKQIYSWLHEKLVDSFDEMTNLSKALREKLDHEYEIKKATMAARQISQVDPTEKFLFELEDGNMIESVLMKYNYGNSVCISSQGGLPHGVPVLCVYHRRFRTKSYSLRDAKTNLSYPEDHRGESVQYRCDGNRRASG